MAELTPIAFSTLTGLEAVVVHSLNTACRSLEQLSVFSLEKLQEHVLSFLRDAYEMPVPERRLLEAYEMLLGRAIDDRRRQARGGS